MIKEIIAKLANICSLFLNITLASNQLGHASYKVDTVRHLVASETSLEREYHGCNLLDQFSELDRIRCEEIQRLYLKKLEGDIRIKKA